MANEVFANNASTTLASGVNNSSNPVTVAVADASKFPTTGNFRIIIDDEIMLVTAVSGGNFTASRAQEGTTIANHASGATVTQILTAASLIQAFLDRNLKGTYGSRPTAGLAGRQYQCTDVPYLFRDNGSTWDAFGPILPMYPPDDSLYSWINQGTATIDNSLGIPIMSFPNLSTDHLRIRRKAAPATPYTITACISCNGFAGAYISAGLCFIRSTGGGPNIMFFTTNEGSSNPARVGFSSTGGGSWGNVNNILAGADRHTWMRIKNDGTTMSFWFSNDGVSWYLFFQEAISVRMGAVDGVGWCGLNEIATASTMTAALLSWNET